MSKYKIELNNKTLDFDLYVNGDYHGSYTLVGEILNDIDAMEKLGALGQAPSESYMFYKLKDLGVDIDMEDW